MGQEKNKRDYMFENVKEALKDMSKEVVTKHMDMKAHC
jgi:hypothetical protein